jgi:uncharacterized protein DUF4349
MNKRGIGGLVVLFLFVAGVIGLIAGSHGFSPRSPTLGAGGGTKGGAAPVAPQQAGPLSNRGSAVDEGVTLPELGAKVVKTAALSLGLKRGTFSQQVEQATLIAGRHGGFVQSSQVTQAKLQSGTLTVRVPASQFEAALHELTGLGKVRSEQISGQDVTAQFVDLRARLKNWESQEAVLLGLMGKATSIADSIRVQQQLSDVQLQIEQIRGQLNVLSDQADMSTITVSMFEGTGPVRPEPVQQATLAKAWHQSVHGFVAVVAAVVVGLGYLIPVTAVALALALGVRLLRTRAVKPA